MREKICPLISFHKKHSTTQVGFKGSGMPEHSLGSLLFASIHGPFNKFRAGK